MVGDTSLFDGRPEDLAMLYPETGTRGKERAWWEVNDSGRPFWIRCLYENGTPLDVPVPSTAKECLWNGAGSAA